VIARHRALLSLPGFSRLLVSSVLARLPSGMFSLAILLFVRGRTDSFFVAGVAVGAFALAGALVGPPLGALVDRVGQTRVLLPAAVAQATLLVGLVAVAQAGAGVAAIVALAALAGAAQPPIAGCIRALWSHVAADGQALETAYALDATTQEVIWTLGPLLVGATAVLLSPAVAVLACAAITVCGTTFFATSNLSSGWRAHARKRSRRGALASPGLRALLATVVLSGVVIGAVEVGLPALAVAHGARWSAGPLLALFSVGSMAGGLLYSAASWRRAIGLRYIALLLAMAMCVAPLIAAHALAAAYPLSALAGLGLAPMLSCQFSLVGTLAPVGAATEAFTWHRGATIAGMAAGSTLGGSLIDAHGAAGAFALGCASVALACLLAMLWRGGIDPVHTPGGVTALPVGSSDRPEAHQSVSARRTRSIAPSGLAPNCRPLL
jgi:MFS family permease